MNRFLLFILVLTSPALLYAQPDPQAEESPQGIPVLQDTRLKVGLGFLVQHQLNVTGNTSAARQLSFSFPTARLRLNSVWEGRIKLFMQADFVRSPSILDAQLTIPIVDNLELDAGLFKSPFSREFLLFPEDLPFAERSRVVQALAPNRQIGVALRLRLLEDQLTLEAGAFNGNGAVLESNDNDQFMYTARLNWTRPFSVGGAQVGINGAYSEDTLVDIPSIGFSNGERIVLGADGEIVTASWLVRVEFIAASFGAGSVIDTAYGYTATVGYKLFGMHQFYAAFDVLDRGFGETEYGMVSYKAYLTDILQVLANYRFALANPDLGYATLRLQVAFR